MVITAPEGVHIDAITDIIETQLISTRLSLEMLRGGRLSFKHKPFHVNFQNGSRIMGRIPQRSGVGVKGVHPIWLELDEASDYPSDGWTELMETLKRGHKGAVWRCHGVTRGVRDKHYYRFTADPNTQWRVHRYSSMWRPTWTDEERQEKIMQYGSKDDPDYRRNILGLHGDSVSPIFVLSRLMNCVDDDKESDYNADEYQFFKINDSLLAEQNVDIIQLLDFPPYHLSKYNTFWVGMDVGMTNHPSEILIFAEELLKPSSEEYKTLKRLGKAISIEGKPRLKLVTRINLTRIATPDQVRAMLWVIDFYKPRAFSLDKMQPVSEPVLTPSGWVPIGSLSEGDLVIGSDGAATKVVGVFPQDDRRVVRVTFSDGSSTRCGPEHLWTIKLRKRRCVESMSVTTGQMMELARRYGSSKITIPLLSGPVEYEQGPELPIDPYVLGCLLGDGNLRLNGIRFSSVDEEILDNMRSRLPEGFEVKHTDRCNYIVKADGWRHERNSKGQFCHRNPILDVLRDLGLAGTHSWDKFIPEVYLRATPDERLELLRGLMDTDGYCSVQNDGCTIAIRLSSETMIRQIGELVQSLGGVTRFRDFTTSCNGKAGRHGYQVTMGLPVGVNPFRLSRKRDAVIPRRRAITRHLEAIDPQPDEQSVCIRVAAEDELYVTRDHILTHNTGIGLPLFQELQDKNRQAGTVVKGYGFSEKRLVGFDESIEVEEGISNDDLAKEAGIMRNVVEYACVDEETELLTRRGWKHYQEVIENEDIYTLDWHSQKGEWVPVEKILQYEGSHPVRHIRTRCFDAVTTLNHRWWTERYDPYSKKRIREWRTTDTLRAASSIPLRAEPGSNPIESIYSDSLVELVAWFWTEGHFRRGRKSFCGAGLAQSEDVNSVYVKRIRECIEEVFDKKDWRQSSRNGMVEWHLSAVAARFLNQYVTAYEKIVRPEFIASLTLEQLNLFIETSIDADGWRQVDGAKLGQSSLDRLRSFEMACVLAGRSIHTWQRSDLTGWVTTLLVRDNVTPISTCKISRNVEVRTLDYNYSGIVWCPRSRNNTFLARRNGSIYYTGNTDKLRLLVDEKRLWLPWDEDLIAEYQGQTYKVVRSAMNQYGKKEFSQGKFHALDASRMAILGWAQYQIEEMMGEKNKVEPVLERFGL